MALMPIQLQEDLSKHVSSQTGQAGQAIDGHMEFALYISTIYSSLISPMILAVLLNFVKKITKKYIYDMAFVT